MGGRPMRDDLPSMNPSSWSDIDEVIRTPHGVFIMLNNNDCITEVTQVKQRIQ